MSTTDNPDWVQGALHAGRQISRQIDPGTYTVRKKLPNGSFVHVGWCFAEVNGGNVKTEHYVMFHGYSPPTVDQALIIERTPPSGPNYSSLTAYFDAMHQQQPAGQPYSYIKSTCAYHSAVP